MHFYSQHGEDGLLWEFFKDTSDGFYVDVGAFDGKHLSNTYVFDRKGWDGICIEPEGPYFDLCRQVRTASCFNVACVSDSSIKTLEFMTLDQGGLGSQAKEAFEKTKHKRKFTFSTTRVQAVTLNEILSTSDVNTIDLLSLDVEGLEIDVLKGFDIAKYKPRVMVIEANTPEAKAKLDLYLAAFGYVCAGNINVNYFYALNKEDILALRAIDTECHLKNEHPTNKKAGTNKDGVVRIKLNENS